MICNEYNGYIPYIFITYLVFKLFLTNVKMTLITIIAAIRRCTKSHFFIISFASVAEERAREMMGSESYYMAIATIQKVDKDLEKLTMPPMRKVAAKAKKREKSSMEFDYESKC